MGSWQIRYFLYTIALSFFLLECSCFTSYSASVLVSTIQGSESVTHMHISSHKIPPPPPCPVSCRILHLNKESIIVMISQTREMKVQRGQGVCLASHS